MRTLVERPASLGVWRAERVETYGQNTAGRLGVARGSRLAQSDEVRRAQHVVDRPIEDRLSAAFEDRERWNARSSEPRV